MRNPGPLPEGYRAAGIRLACCLVLSSINAGLHHGTTARAAEPLSAPLSGSLSESLPAYFSQEPPDALIHRLQPGPGWSMTTPGLVISQRHRWLPKLRLLVIDSTLTNNGRAAAGVKGTCIGDWTFRLWEDRDAPGYRKLTYRNDTWYGSTYWTGPDWTRVGKDWHHPGNRTPSVRRFTAPRDGRLSITGRVYKAHLDGDGVRVSIRHGRRTLWMAEIKGKDARGVEPRLALKVRKGDAIRFVVHKLGEIYCDTTRWDPVITYADGGRYQASEGFSTEEQGDGGWSYEMETHPNDRSGLPHVRAFTRELALRDEPVVVGRPANLSDRDLLPLMVVADGADRSGLALALSPAGSWRCSLTMTGRGLLHVKLAVGDEKPPAALRPGESMRLPRIVLGAYRGPSHAGVALFQPLVDSGARDLGLEKLQECFAAAECSDLGLLAMVQADWHQQDRIDGTARSYAAATARHLEQATRLLADLRQGQPDDFLAAEARQLGQLAAEAKRPGLGLEDQRSLYRRVRRLKREIALANPLMQFGELLFCKRVPTSYSHLVMQYFGWRARAGGGLFILERPGRSLRCRDITGGKLDGGSVLEPRLSYDAKRIVFSYVECREKSYDPAQIDNAGGGGYYHIWEINVDLTSEGHSSDLLPNRRGLRQLTHGDHDDLMPVYLPDGGIAFSSTRRRGYARCFGGQFSRRWHVYTLHRADADGKNIRALSFHDTNEWFPTVLGDGRILYARWDYIDRDAVTHQNLWAMRPDGTNPVAVWGNATSSPHCAFQAKPIPGSENVVFTGSAHHSITAGSLAILDPTVGRDGHKALTRITPEIPFPEAEARDIREYYASPWPLSEKYFLVSYSPVPLVWEPGANPPGALGIYLLDVFGNRELIYRDPEISSTNPTPLVPRPRPPVLPSRLPGDAAPTGEVLLVDVYRGLGDVPRGTIKQLRVIQVFPKTTPLANDPRMGIAGEENGRAILGSVPVEPDGSARFVVPAQKPILFQALDKDGLAYQTMRTVTYLQPGERVSCVGCHENRMSTPAPADAAALRRRPSPIDPGPLGGRPFSFTEMVQPVLNKHCLTCHGGETAEGHVDLSGTPAGAWTTSYVSLTRDPKLVPRFPARNQIQVTPVGGAYGALGSRLMKLLRDGHEGVKLNREETRRLAAWIDCNAIFYGTPNPAEHPKQLRGEPVRMPEIQ